MTLVLVAWLLCGILSAVIASSKNLNVALWAVVGLLFGVFGLLIVLVVPAENP